MTVLSIFVIISCPLSINKEPQRNTDINLVHIP